ncbi:MAG: outer membrane protein assembly factor BamD [Helicobacter sp.]|nr:outer membrane protein assembly factor BamD [Helicobacter sp.]
MLSEIRFGNLEGADDKFASLQSEHINSPLIKEAMLILAHAHMRESEYLLAGFYFDEYLKRYGDASNFPFVAYLKLQANYYAFDKENINQQLLLDTIRETEDYLRKYPHSPYYEAVTTLLVRMVLSNAALNDEIARIYRIRDADEAAEMYQERKPYAWVDSIPAEPAHLPWYRIPFDW